MGQYYHIFNLTKGKVLNVQDGWKFTEKYMSIIILVILLQNEWKNDEIVMIGDYDESDKSFEFVNTFLSKYNLKIANEDESAQRFEDGIVMNLYNLYSNGDLPKKADLNEFEIVYSCEGKKPVFYPNKYNKDEKIIIEKVETNTYDVYLFLDHTTKEYIRFDNEFFEGFWKGRKDGFTDEKMKFTMIQLNQIMINIIKNLIANLNIHSDCKTEWSGRFAGHSLSFEKENEEFVLNYTNVTNILSNKEELFKYEDDIFYDPEHVVEEEE